MTVNAVVYHEPYDTGVEEIDDPHAPEQVEEQGVLEINFAELFSKGLQVGTGQTPVKQYNRRLRDMIIEGRAEPSFLISHRESLQDAPEMYERFDEHEEGVTKVLLSA